MRINEFLMVDHLVHTGKIKIKGFPDIRKNGRPYNYKLAKCLRCKKYMTKDCKDNYPTNNNSCKDYKD